MEAARWVSWLLRFVSAGSGTLGTNARWQRPRITPRTQLGNPELTRTRAVLAGAIAYLDSLPPGELERRIAEQDSAAERWAR